MIQLKMEKTLIEEKETFIHISNDDKTVKLYTTDAKILNRMCKKLGTPHTVFAPVNSISDDDTTNYISGASWTYNYYDNKVQDKIRQIFSKTNLLTRNKNTTK